MNSVGKNKELELIWIQLKEQRVRVDMVPAKRTKIWIQLKEQRVRVDMVTDERTKS